MATSSNTRNARRNIKRRRKAPFDFSDDEGSADGIIQSGTLDSHPTAVDDKCSRCLSQRGDMQSNSDNIDDLHHSIQEEGDASIEEDEGSDDDCCDNTTIIAAAAVAVSSRKIPPNRMALLLLCLGLSSTSTSSLMNNAAVATASSVDAKIKRAGITKGKDEEPTVLIDSTMQQRNTNLAPAEVDLEDDQLLEDILLSGYDSSLDISDYYEDNDNESPPITEQVEQQQKKNPQKIQVHSQGTSNSATAKLKQTNHQDSASTQQQQSSSSSKKSSDNRGGKDSVIILSAVDGTLAGISRSSGQVLWKQSRDQITHYKQQQQDEDNNDDGADNSSSEIIKSPEEWNKFLSPLVHSTKSTTKHNNDIHQWHAVPSIDGTVYLTGGGETTSDGTGGGQHHELSISTHIRDLVNRAPFVDAHQRFFVGSRRAMVAAVDERTGEILRVIPKWKSEEQDEDNEDDELLPPSLEGRDVVWIGRLEHTVTVHDLHRGTVDIEFSVAEILSVDEMIHGPDTSMMRPTSPSSLVIPEEGGGGEGINDDDSAKTVATRREEEEMEQLFTEYITEALRHPSFGDRILRLPAPQDDSDETGKGDKGGEYPNKSSGKSSSSSSSSVRYGSPFLVSTPSGNVAFRDDSDSATVVGWVSFDLLDSPVVYAIEASSGQKIRVNMLDDSSVSPAAGTSSEDDNGLPQMLQQQIALIESAGGMMDGDNGDDDACQDGDKSGECRAVGFSTQGSVVGALQSGQIYALPLGERISYRPQLPLGLPQPDIVDVNSASAPHEYHKQQHRSSLHSLNTHHATIGFHEHRHDSSGDVDSGDKQHIHLDAKDKQSCTPGSPIYPGCLIGASLMMGNLMDVDGNLDMASVFASTDLDYDLYLDLLEGNNRKKNSYFHQFMKIMSSWIAPTVALLFVLSFEMGRRERLKILGDASAGSGVSEEESKEALGSASKNNQGVIQLSDEILGYGGHGTIVYKGELDKRQVAVKRLLAMYHASADREISLLIESDGHPNVVRYFLKEMRGDFVYLALELCDMSLNDLIVSLGKLKNARKENFSLQMSGTTDDFENATKSLLFQVASGVRHIHSLRIVHRDLKPQNILLALRGKSKSAIASPEESGGSDSETGFDDTTHPTCSETNTILECFRNQDYVPKISDMGLGKQLAGQSSFGLSTLGTGSVGGAAGDAGAGAGSVGWQAPEVMAQRWSPESSSNNNETSESLMEASPLEAGVNARTSRSVDIFSLGCIFYCTILPGSHPFGEWYEREANIMKNTPNKGDLKFVSPDASDLILSMINRDAKARPTAKEVCDHPFFWSLSKRLKFLCELSDRIELCDTTMKADNRPPAFNILAIEAGAYEVFGTSWEKKLDYELIEASLSRRTYDPSSVRDCLRMIRNKHHHYDELPTKLKSKIGSNTDGLSSYVSRTFPQILMHCYHFCVSNLAEDDSLAIDYKLPISRYQMNRSSKTRTPSAPVIADMSPLHGTKKHHLETIPDDGADQEDDDDRTATPDLKEEEEPKQQDTEATSERAEPQNSDDKSDEPPPLSTIETQPSALLENKDLSGVVVWSGSNTARELNQRGWYRSEEEWASGSDGKLRKPNKMLARCAEDPKFRTRLCNHWDVSQGIFCPMRKKNKCVFAHGPVELRVKEGKSKRWGTLVNKHGLCANPKASGGEDTYGAARSIENTRKEQGQWSTKPGKGKTNNKGGKQTPKKKKEQP